MLQQPQQGGGNTISEPIIWLRRNAAIGDVIACSVVADKLVERGHRVGFQAHPTIHCILRRIASVSFVSTPGSFCHVNLDGCYERDPGRTKKHFSTIFMAAAQAQLQRFGMDLGPALNCRPKMTVPANSKAALSSKLEEFPRPWVFICPKSQWYAARQVPDEIWREAAKKIEGTKFWMGMNPAPQGIIDLSLRTVDSVLERLSVADLLVTVDTGPMHMAAAMGIPVLAIGQSSSPELHLSDQVDFMTIGPSLDCLNCQQYTCPIDPAKPPCQKVDPELISAWANDRLRATQSEDVSVVIPIFRPASEMLNRCLEAVLPQASEVITTRERAGVLPSGVLSHAKLRHVVKPADKIGFGRNVNFGVRHSRGRYVLVLNDDVYLESDAVANMMKVMRPGVGIVGHLTYYPDGTIYHGGKPRSPDGGIGFPHLDLRQRWPSIKEPMEMENTNGCSILFRRRAFFDADGYDEAFQFYAEDDDICMKVRRAGWKLWYTPKAIGIHDEHQETKNVPGIREIMQQSNKRFGQKWAPYFKHNANNRGLGNFDYLSK